MDKVYVILMHYVNDEYDYPIDGEDVICVFDDLKAVEDQVYNWNQMLNTDPKQLFSVIKSIYDIEEEIGIDEDCFVSNIVDFRYVKCGLYKEVQ